MGHAVLHKLLASWLLAQVNRMAVFNANMKNKEGIYASSHGTTTSIGWSRNGAAQQTWRSAISRPSRQAWFFSQLLLIHLLILVSIASNRHNSSSWSTVVAAVVVAPESSKAKCFFLLPQIKAQQGEQDLLCWETCFFCTWRSPRSLSDGLLLVKREQVEILEPVFDSQSRAVRRRVVLAAHQPKNLRWKWNGSSLHCLSGILKWSAPTASWPTFQEHYQQWHWSSTPAISCHEWIVPNKCWFRVWLLSTVNGIQTTLEIQPNTLVDHHNTGHDCCVEDGRVLNLTGVDKSGPSTLREVKVNFAVIHNAQEMDR